LPPSSSLQGRPVIGCLISILLGSGTLTGKRFQLDKNATVFTNTDSLTYLPGTVDGTSDGTAAYNGKQPGIETQLPVIYDSNIYAPTVVLTTNLASASVGFAIWLRIGNHVMVTGRLTADATATGACECQIPLPVASNFTSALHVLGLFATDNVAHDVGRIEGDTVTKRARFLFTVTQANQVNYGFHFSYLIVP